MPSALIFDFDGTIADTLNQARLVLNELAEDYGFQKIATEEVVSLQGMTVDQLIKHLGIKRRWVPILLAKGVKRLRSRIKEIDLCAGMHSAIPELAENFETLGILTSNSVENVELFLNRHGLREHFAFISSTSKLKGKAKHLKAISRTFSIPREEMIYIGDEVRDLRAAQKAQVPVIAVTWGFNNFEALQDESPRALVHSTSELLDALSA